MTRTPREKQEDLIADWRKAADTYDSYDVLGKYAATAKTLRGCANELERLLEGQSITRTVNPAVPNPAALYTAGGVEPPAHLKEKDHG